MPVMLSRSQSLKRYYVKISTLKSRITKANNRERFIRDQIKERVEGDKPIFSSDWIRWRQQLNKLRIRKINLNAMLRNAQRAQEIELAKQKTLASDGTTTTIATHPEPSLEDKHRVGLDSSGVTWHPWQEL